MTITEVTPDAATDTDTSRPPGLVSGPAEETSPPAETTSQTSKRKTIKPQRDWLMTALSFVAAVGGTAVGAIGFAMSYSTQRTVALKWGFSEKLAPWFPIGVDASIISFLALDLYLIRKKAEWPLLRLAAHAMTAATIWFNASSQGEIADDPVQAASHAVMPILFVVGVEAARRLFIKKANLAAGTHIDRIPWNRWVLAPIATPKLFRRMKLRGITSYPEMIKFQQGHIAYRQWLERKYNGDLSKADDDEKLPMTMERYGFTVDEALALPEQQAQEAAAREEAAEQRRLDAETSRKERETAAAAQQLRADGRLEAVRAEVEGETEEARTHARAKLSAAEKAAKAEQEALETEATTQARARTAEAERQEQEDRKKAAGEALEAAELERQAAEKRKAAEATERAAAAETEAIETAKAAAARRAASEDDAAAAEAERAAAETRRAVSEEDAAVAEARARKEAALAQIERDQQAAAEAERAAVEARQAAAEAELRAVESEDVARLSPRKRAVSRVARMILTQADGQPEQLPLEAIREQLGVVDGTASEYRQEAAALIGQGYTLPA